MANLEFKQAGRISLFDKDEGSEKLSKLGNPLEKLHKVIDFDMFRPILEATMLNQERKSNVGPKSYDVVMMFKIILLKRFYNLSDEQAEYQINDRLSFKEFLGLSSGDRVPDSRTIWLFQENLIKKSYGRTSRERKVRKILMFAGQKKTNRNITDIKTTQKLMQEVNL